MATWIFEPGDTAEFCVRHMMVAWVCGFFKNIHRSLEFEPDDPATLSLQRRLRHQISGPESNSATPICGAVISWT